MKRILFSVGLLLMVFLTGCHRSVVSYVNPFVGTDEHGHTFPGAIVPFGSIQPSPDTRLDGWDGCSAYHYSDDTIYGFSHTHLSGTGCSDYGDLLLMPFTDSAFLQNDKYASGFKHRHEEAHPGYYRVILDKNKVMVELTASKRVAMHHYTYPKTGTKGFIIDLTHRDKVLGSSMQVLNGKIVGYRLSEAWNPNQYYFFALEVKDNVDHIDFYEDDVLKHSYVPGEGNNSCDRVEGLNCKAVVYLKEQCKESTIKVAGSAVDGEGALNNLADYQGFDFKQMSQEATRIWEKELSKIEVETKVRTDKQNFYTALYHCMTAPYLYSDADGRYRGQDDSIHTTDGKHEMYTVFSLWDTYRTLNPLLSLIDKKRTADFIYSFMRHFEQGGELTMWELSSHETHCMIGYHAVPVILDAFTNGCLDGFSQEDKQLLLHAMVATSITDQLGHLSYAKQGYLSSEMENESVSKTLEYAYDDWCIAQFAQKIMPTADSSMTDSLNAVYRTYIQRAQSYKNLMDENGFMHPKRNGGFLTPYSPAEVNNHYTEANSWQISTYVPHDVKGFVQCLGGADKLEMRLDSLFHTNAQLEGREQSDITGLIGQYAHGNEPSHHAAYLYDYIGKYSKTAELVRKICTELYQPTPEGLCGNEDCGQMSAWFVMSSLGFYPVCPGSGYYAMGSPLFSKATIHFEDGTSLVINCKNQDKKNPYIQQMDLNGEPVSVSFLTYPQLSKGGELHITMGASPSAFGEKIDENYFGSAIPAKDAITPTPYFDNWEQRFTGERDVKILTQATRKGDSIYYTLDGSIPTTASIAYREPIHVSGDVTITAIAYNPASGYSKPVKCSLTQFIADKKLSYVTKPDPQYTENGAEGLIDRLRGNSNYKIGGWQGWTQDMEVIVDLLEPRAVTGAGCGTLANMRSWIFFPSQVEVWTSNDGKNFTPFGKVENDHPAVKAEEGDEVVKDFVVNGNAVARYLKIKATNYGKLPEWHVSAGEQAWLFVDEIIVR